MNSLKTASLTSALLARKGAAAPAAIAPAAVVAPTVLEYRAPVWPKPAAPAPVVRPGPMLDAGREPSREATRSPKADHTGWVKLSLRLDPRQHLRLKLIAAHLRVSIQSLMTEAFDRYLEQATPPSLKETCGCLRPDGASRTGWPKLTERSPFAKT
jgi:hypothetical protein